MPDLSSLFAQNIDLSPWLQIVERLGVPLAVLLATAYGVWRSGTWLAEHVATPLVSSHTSLVDQLRTSDRKQSEALEKIAETQQNIAQTQLEIVQLLRGQRG